MSRPKPHPDDDALLNLLELVLDAGMEMPPEALPLIYRRLRSLLEEIVPAPRGAPQGDAAKAARFVQIYVEAGVPRAKARETVARQFPGLTRDQIRWADIKPPKRG